MRDEQELEEARARTTGFRPRLRSAANRARGIPIEADLGPYWRTVDRIHAHSKDHGLDRASDEALKAQALDLAGRIRAGLPTEQATVEAFALVAAAARRSETR